MIRFNSLKSYFYRAPVSERNCGKSNVVPDMTLSLAQLIDRHVNGKEVKTFRPVQGAVSGVHGLNFERMSKIDQAQLYKDLPRFISTTRGQIISAREARRREALIFQGKQAPSPAPEPAPAPASEPKTSSKQAEGKSEA